MVRAGVAAAPAGPAYLTEANMGFWAEFKEFAVKGNAIDMAVGIIIGAAFTKIVNSLVNDIIMPPIGLALGGTTFNDLKYVMKQGAPANPDTGAVAAPEVAIRYGAFISTIIDFLIVALVIFMVLKMMNVARERAFIPFLGRPAPGSAAPPPGNPPPKA
jgi:large conductance mechanosensitive channel